MENFFRQIQWPTVIASVVVTLLVLMIFARR